MSVPGGVPPGGASARELADVRRALTALDRAVTGLRARHADTLGLRRLASDVRRLNEDVDLLGELRPAVRTGDRLPRLEFVPDAPYSDDLWHGADDEGLDGRAR